LSERKPDAANESEAKRAKTAPQLKGNNDGSHGAKALSKQAIFTELHDMGFVKSSRHPRFEAFAKRNPGQTVYALQGIKDGGGNTEDDNIEDDNMEDDHPRDIIVQTKAGRRSALEAYRQAKAKDKAGVEVKAEGDCLSKGNDEDFVEFGFATSRALRLLFPFLK
jgi:hypothetical protein